MKLAALIIHTIGGDPVLSGREAFRIASRAWAIWVIWWLGMAFLSKSTKRRESALQRIEHLFPAILGIFLIFREGGDWGWLTRPIFPDEVPLMLGGVIATIAGLLFSMWARLVLGSNWSGSVTIKQNHQLIRRGPYRFVRHPIYTGMLMALLATAL